MLCSIISESEALLTKQHKLYSAIKNKQVAILSDLFTLAGNAVHNRN